LNKCVKLTANGWRLTQSVGQIPMMLFLLFIVSSLASVCKSA